MGEGIAKLSNKNVFEYRKKYLREGLVAHEETRIVSVDATVWFPRDCFTSWERYKQLTTSFYNNELLGITHTTRDDGNVCFRLAEDTLLNLWYNQEQGLPLADVHIKYKPFYVREDEATAWVYERMKEIFAWLRN